MYILEIESTIITEPIYENFYFIKKRDELNLLLIRYFAEGNIILKGTDFDLVVPFFDRKATGKFTENTDVFDIEITFSIPDFAKKTVKAAIFIKDKYYNFFENPILNFQSDIDLYTLQLDRHIINNTPQVEYEFTNSEIDTASLKPSDLDDWNDPSKSGEFDNLATTLNCTPIIITETPENAKNSGWKPLQTLYTNFVGIRYLEKQTFWAREVAWFAENEVIPSGFIALLDTQTIRGIIYTKYVRGPYKGTKPFEVGAFTIDKSLITGVALLSYVDTYYNINSRAMFFKDVILELIKKIDNTTPSTVSIPIFENDPELSLFITGMWDFSNENNNELSEKILKDFNVWGGFYDATSNDEIYDLMPEAVVLMNFEYIITMLRDSFGLYFEIDDYTHAFDVYQFIRLDFGAYPVGIDLNNYRGQSWLNENNYIVEFLQSKPSNVLFETGSTVVDFRDQEGTFDRNLYKKESQSLSLVSDLKSSGGGNFFLFSTEIFEFDLLNLNFNVTSLGAAVSTSIGASAVTFQANVTQSFACATNVFPSQGGTLNLKYDYDISQGSVAIKINDVFNKGVINTIYFANLTGTGTVDININLLNINKIKYYMLMITSPLLGQSSGVVNNISITRINSKRVLKSIGYESGISKQNAAISAANLLNKYPVIMPDTQGDINGNEVGLTKVFDKTQQFQVPIDSDMSAINFNEKITTNYSDMVLFEVKRHILDKDNRGFDTITVKDNA